MARLHLDRLSVSSFYGRPFEGLDELLLGEGVTVVYGPNGQGKTTVARAVQGALWPETVAAHRPSYTARFRVGEAPWRVTLDAGAPLYERGDAPAGAPDGLPDAHHRARYCLGLRDLLTEDGRTFADQVLRDAAGGVDLGQIRAAVGARDAVRRSTPAAAEARDAAQALRQLRAERARLRGDEDTLGELRRRAEAAEADAGRADLLDLLAERAERRAAVEAAERTLAAFPAALEHLGADTAERYREAREAAEAAAARREAAEAAVAEAVAARDAHAWSGVEAPATTLLLARLDELKTADRDLGDAARELAAAAAREAKARDALGAPPADGAPRLDGDAFRTVHDAAATAAQAQAFADELRARIDTIKKRVVHIEPRDEDALRRGIDALRTWLAYTPDADAPAPTAFARGLWMATVALVFVSVILAVVWHPAAAVGLVGALGVAAAAHRLGRPVAMRDDRPSVAQRTYAALELQAPREWQPAHVQARLDEHEKVLARQGERRVWTERRQELETRLDEADDKAAAAAAAAAEVAAGYGLALAGGPAALVSLAGRTVQWQDAAADRAAAEGRRAEAEAGRDAALFALSALLRGLPCGAALDASEGAAHVETVRTGTAEAERLAEAAARAEADRDVARGADATARAGLLAVLEPLDLQPDTPGLDGVVARLAAQRDAYGAAQAALAEARALADDAARRAAAHALYTDALGALGAAETARRRDEARASAARRDDWLAQAAAVGERLDAARAGTALEDARARHDAALAALEADYDAAADALVANVLADAVDEATRDEHLPAVFGAAREKLLAITADRVRLAFDARTATFRAVDVPTGRTHALDELSGGTRLQLLLAVRLAFAEHQERSLQLPILLDEALANSDDGRADRVVQSILDLAAGGRQILYFTAQAEEVARWQRQAAASGAPCTVVTLPAGAPAPAAEALPAYDTAAALPAPQPGETLEAYAARLGAPAWSARDAVSALPLWTLLDRAATLHSLAQRGYATWGQVLSAMQRGVALPADAAELGRATDRVRAVTAWREAWHVGRGRPVGRAALVASGAVSERYLDELLAICDDCEGDAERILAAARGDVKTFRTHKADELEAFLLDGGYLAQTDALSDAELRRRACEAATDADLALDTLRRLRAAGTGEASAARDGDGRAAVPAVLP